MKKTFTTFIAILLVFFSVFSGPVNKEEAKQIAEKFYNSYAPASKHGSSINKIITEHYKQKESFYIFGFENGGFVIISADDNSTPILGYSFSSPIKEVFNSNIRYLFDRYNKEIAEANKLEIPNLDIKNKWGKLRRNEFSKKTKAVAPLLETSWNQSPYYNDYCPPNTPTGCVATAMSQIMNYHEWPASGNGWHKYIPSEHLDFGIQYADFSEEIYDWVNMPDQLNSSNSSTEIDAIATLNYHAGVSVNMQYDSDGSGAFSRDVMYSLTSYFKYDPTTIEFIDFDVTNETDFINDIKTEIDNNRPVYYSGQGTSGGHAWVCDGYSDDNKVHINWGWGGSYNGYFEVAAMNPGTYNFNESNSIIIGIQPGNTVQDMQWTKKASGFKTASRGIQYISAIDKRTAWAVAFDGAGDGANVKEFTRTVDGYNWVSGTINAEGTDGLSAAMISAINKDTAWVALFDGTNGGGKIVKTSDGGQNWIHQSTATFTPPSGFPNVVHFWDANYGWCQGDPNDDYFELYTTSDGGSTWTRVPEANIPTNENGEYGTVGYYAVYGDIIWFATNKGRIFKSTDKGNNWTVTQTPISDASFELSFKNENIGIIQKRGSDDNQIQYITTNGGSNWVELNPVGNFYTNSFKFIPGENLLISSGSDYETPAQGISYSTDNGATFTDYANFYKNYQFGSIGSAGIDAIWAGGFNVDENNEGIWYYGNPLICAGFISDNTEYCVNDNITFTDDSYGTPDSWTWNFGEGASPASATGSGPHEVTYSTSGLKNITLTIDKTSDTQVLVKKEYIYISGSIPNDAGTITGEANVTAGEKHTYSVINQDFTTFNWDIPSQWIGTSTSNEIEIEFTGSSSDGTITVTPTNVCGDGILSSLNITSNPSVGFDNIDNNIISVYPNPAKEFISIAGIEYSSIYLYDISGNLVKVIHNSENNSPIEIKNLSSGIYQIHIITNNKTYKKTISIVK